MLTTNITKDRKRLTNIICMHYILIGTISHTHMCRIIALTVDLFHRNHKPIC